MIMRSQKLVWLSIKPGKYSYLYGYKKDKGLKQLSLKTRCDSIKLCETQVFEQGGWGGGKKPEVNYHKRNTIGTEKTGD